MLHHAFGGEGIMEAFLWEVVLVLRPKLGGCEKWGLIQTAVSLEEAQRGRVHVGIMKRWLERQAGPRSRRAQPAKVGSLT